MKKTRLYVGVSFFALALVGVAATKANNKLNPYYYKDGSSCIQVDLPTDCDFTGSQCFYENNSHLPMYAVNDAGICKAPLLHE